MANWDEAKSAYWKAVDSLKENIFTPSVFEHSPRLVGKITKGKFKGTQQNGKGETEPYYAHANEVVDSLKDADILLSKTTTGTHMPVIDLDIPHMYLPSTQEGHGHLLLDVQMLEQDYFDLLDILAKYGIVEAGYAGAAKAQGFSAVRLPWIKKDLTKKGESAPSSVSESWLDPLNIVTSSSVSKDSAFILPEVKQGETIGISGSSNTLPSHLKKALGYAVDDAEIFESAAPKKKSSVKKTHLGYTPLTSEQLGKAQDLKLPLNLVAEMTDSSVVWQVSETTYVHAFLHQTYQDYVTTTYKSNKKYLTTKTPLHSYGSYKCVWAFGRFAQNSPEELGGYSGVVPYTENMSYNYSDSSGIVTFYPEMGVSISYNQGILDIKKTVSNQSDSKVMAALLKSGAKQERFLPIPMPVRFKAEDYVWKSGELRYIAITPDGVVTSYWLSHDSSSIKASSTCDFSELSDALSKTLIDNATLVYNPAYPIPAFVKYDLDDTVFCLKSGSPFLVVKANTKNVEGYWDANNVVSKYLLDDLKLTSLNLAYAPEKKNLYVLPESALQKITDTPVATSVKSNIVLTAMHKGLKYGLHYDVDSLKYSITSDSPSQTKSLVKDSNTFPWEGLGVFMKGASEPYFNSLSILKPPTDLWESVKASKFLVEKAQQAGSPLYAGVTSGLGDIKSRLFIACYSEKMQEAYFWSYYEEPLAVLPATVKPFFFDYCSKFLVPAAKAAPKKVSKKGVTIKTPASVFKVGENGVVPFSADSNGVLHFSNVALNTNTTANSMMAAGKSATKASASLSKFYESFGEYSDSKSIKIGWYSAELDFKKLTEASGVKGIDNFGNSVVPDYVMKAVTKQGSFSYIWVGYIGGFKFYLLWTPNHPDPEKKFALCRPSSHKWVSKPPTPSQGKWAYIANYSG